MWWMLWLCMPVFANGQSSHLWISEQAIVQLPVGDLKALLSDVTLERYWRNGTMFPDGGYAVNDDYGEMAHWEPFQLAYLQWIQDTFAPPWSPEAKQHIAFLMGLASHGLADQSFDAMYFRRAYVYDADSTWVESFDTATDIAFVASTEVQPTVEVWVPSVVYDIYQQQGHLVDSSTVEQGQNRLNVAIFWVGSTAVQSDLLATYQAQYPWGTVNQLNPMIPGNPAMEVAIVMAYWQRLWTELHGTEPVPSLLFTHPEAGTYEHPIDKDDIESSLSMGLSMGIQADLLLPNHVRVVSDTGEQHPILVDVFYGNNSHVLNIDPLEDWSLSNYTVILDADLPLNNGERLGEPLEWQFSTRSAPLDSESSDDAVSKGCVTIGTDVSVWLVWLSWLGIRRRR